MIKNFKGNTAKTLFEGRTPLKCLRPIAKVARRKLDMIDYAETLVDLRAPPGNRLERLKGDRRGQHSIRINDQWRICFIWRRDGAYDVEIVDYH